MTFARQARPGRAPGRRTDLEGLRLDAEAARHLVRSKRCGSTRDPGKDMSEPYCDRRKSLPSKEKALRRARRKAFCPEWHPLSGVSSNRFSPGSFRSSPRAPSILWGLARSCLSDCVYAGAPILMLPLTPTAKDMSVRHMADTAVIVTCKRRPAGRLWIGSPGDSTEARDARPGPPPGVPAWPPSRR